MLFPGAYECDEIPKNNDRADNLSTGKNHVVSLINDTFFEKNRGLDNYPEHDRQLW